MKKINFTRLSGKGLAIAVFVCLLAVGGAGIYSYSQVSRSLEGALDNAANGITTASTYKTGEPIASVTAATTSVTKIQDAAPAGAEQTGVPIVAGVSDDNTANIADKPEGNVEDAAILTEINSEACIRPVSGEILNGFSGGELVKSKTLNVWKTHDGIDILAAEGENVKAMTTGIVTEVYEDQLMGVTVVIDHGSGITGYYCNLSTDIPVTPGDEVKAGSIIGTVGKTAESEISEDSHIHFALQKNSVWIDPAALLSGSGS
ncbi:MAG: M23 family metallopeptidase [Ruminococcus sp.]|jgi:murein DD-endopeptidase MepM/ murein hydrolase activator NlpD|nr:M23 family metallopeptidase [Ruminococcus sp.]